MYMVNGRGGILKMLDQVMDYYGLDRLRCSANRTGNHCFPEIPAMDEYTGSAHPGWACPSRREPVI